MVFSRRAESRASGRRPQSTWRAWVEGESISKARISGKRQTGENKNADDATDDEHLLVFQVVVGKETTRWKVRSIKFLTS